MRGCTLSVLLVLLYKKFHWKQLERKPERNYSSGLMLLPIMVKMPVTDSALVNIKGAYSAPQGAKEMTDLRARDGKLACRQSPIQQT